MQSRTARWGRRGIGCALIIVLYGCGGGSGSSTAPEDPVSREQLFAEEAVERVLDRVRVSCTEVICTGDGDAYGTVDSTLGTISIGCQYVCMPVEIDATERRHYWVFLAWRRIETTCFDPNDFDPLILAHITAPCVPTI